MVDQPTRGRARVPITEEQRGELKRLYDLVPTQTRVHHEWNTPEGQSFLSYVVGLAANNVPLRWLAGELGLDDRLLQQAAITRPARNTR